MKVLVFGFLALSIVFSSAASAADSKTQCIHFNGKTICDDGSGPAADTSDTVVAAPAPAIATVSGPTPGDVRTRCRTYSNGSDCRTEWYTCWYPRPGESHCRWLGPEEVGQRYYTQTFGLVFIRSHGYHRYHYRHHH